MMVPIVAADIVTLISLGTAVLGMSGKHNIAPGTKSLKLTTWISIFLVGIDAVSYVMVGPAFPRALIFVVIGLSYVLSNCVLLSFLHYVRVFLASHTTFNLWLFRIPAILTTFNIIYISYSVISGKVFVISADGYFQETGGIPFVTSIICIVILVFITLLSLTQIRNIGPKAVSLLGLYSILPLCAIVYEILGGSDYIVPVTGMSVVIIATLLQNDNSREKLHEANLNLQKVNEKQNAQLVEIQELNKELETRVKIIRTMSQVYYSNYIIDLNTNTFEELSTNDNIRDVVGRQGNAQDNLYLMCDRLINPNYSETVRQFVNLSSIKQRLKDKTFITCDFVGVTTGWSQAYFIRGNVDSDGNFDHVFFATRTINDEKEREDRSRGIIEGLSAEYHTVWLVDKETGKMELIRSSGVSTIKAAVQIGLTFDTYQEAYLKYLNTYVAPEQREQIRKEIALDEVIRQLESKATYSVNYLRRDDEGVVRYHQLGFFNADTGDNKRMFVIGFRDIDQIVKEDQMIKMELQEAKETALAASNAKTSFLFNMSHDIRTPMNAIIGYTDLIEKYHNDEEKCKDYIGKLRTSNEFLLSLINNVLNMARIESGKMVLEEVPAVPGNITLEVAAVYTELFKKKNIDFNVNVDVKAKCVYCDVLKLKEVFLNIISNSYKYTPAGGKVSISVKEIGRENGLVYIESVFTDTGIGMSEDYLPTIFEEFSRERTSTENKIEGTGLGMPIVKKLVEIMGGTISVESKHNEGTTFFVVIPHRIAKLSEVPEISGNSVDFTLFKGKRILLAEDNELNTEIATEILVDKGFVVERAEDGEVAVRMVENHDENYYDLILMDIQMPRMNGYQATIAIRNLDNHKKAGIPIIAMTANAFEEDKKNALNAGMDDHVVKPIDVNNLLKTISVCIDKNRQ